MDASSHSFPSLQSTALFSPLLFYFLPTHLPVSVISGVPLIRADSLLFCFSFVPVTPSNSSFIQFFPLHCKASGQSRCFLSPFFPLSAPPVFLRLSLSPVSSHFHAAHWAAMLCVFIAVCGRGGGPLPATNGLLENIDSYASQSGELGREGEEEKDLE